MVVKKIIYLINKFNKKTQKKINYTNLMKILYLIFKILKKELKINFKKPKNKSLVVFDGMSNLDLNFILNDFEYSVVENRKIELKKLIFLFIF